MIIDENIAINKCKLKDLNWVKNYYNKIKDSKNINYDFVLGYSYLLLSKNKFDKGFDLFDARIKSKTRQFFRLISKINGFFNFYNCHL